MKQAAFEVLAARLGRWLPNFAVGPKILLAGPANGLLKAILFDDSITKHRFYIHIFVQVLCVPADAFSLDLGWRLGGGCHTWEAGTPNAVAELGKVLVADALPFFSSVRSEADVAGAAVALARGGNPYVQQAIAFAAARNNSAAGAIEFLNQFIAAVGRNGYWTEEVRRARKLGDLLASDPVAAQGQLDAWEAETVRNLGLEKFR